MATRLYNQAETKKARKAPMKQTEWVRLMQRTIAQADKIGDRRAYGLRKALADGKTEPMLRRLGIISEADLRREFPEKAK